MFLLIIGEWLLWAFALWVTAYSVLLLLFRPSHNRNWELGHEKLSQIVYPDNSSKVTISNFRNFAWSGIKTAEAKYETRNFDLDSIRTVDVFISHSGNFEGMAHVFLSFGFTQGEKVVVSLETRREHGEKFSPLLGMLRQFEMIYVVGSESDIVGLRTGYRRERVYLYPTIASPEKARELFDVIATKINGVYSQPCMYNTVTNNCTNELTRMVEQISDIRFPLSWKAVLPGYIDEVLYELALIDTSADFPTVKAAHLLNGRTLDEKRSTYSADLRQQVGTGNQ